MISKGIWCNVLCEASANRRLKSINAGTTYGGHSSDTLRGIADKNLPTIADSRVGLVSAFGCDRRKQYTYMNIRILGCLHVDVQLCETKGCGLGFGVTIDHQLETEMKHYSISTCSLSGDERQRHDDSVQNHYGQRTVQC
jgi:hypothetical protein